MRIDGVSGSVRSQNIQATMALKHAAKPSAASKPSLASIEKNYQVAEENSKEWSPKLFGFIPLGDLGGKKMLTITEGKLLDNLTRDRGIMGLKTFQSIAEDAFKTSDQRVPPSTTLPAHAEATIKKMVSELPKEQRAKAETELRNAWPRNDGHNDAFRHAYWNARLTSEYGADWTKQFTTAHEGSNGGSSTREAMDLYNNEVGRQIAIDNPDASPKELADLVKKALDDGKLVVIGGNGHLAWSNTVANGNHGITMQLDGTPNKIETPKGDASAEH